MKIVTGRVLTNPVLCLPIIKQCMGNAVVSAPIQIQRELLNWIRNMEGKSAVFPSHVRDEFLYHLPDAELKSELPNPRVVGLRVDTDGEEPIGLVNPLEVAPNGDRGLDVANSLPFVVGQVQDCIYRLLTESTLNYEASVPELFSYRFHDQLNERSLGSSMNIAALLALVDAVNGKQAELFRCACAVVEPDVDQPELLIEVGSIETKLDAFLREYGSGSLLVRRHSASGATNFDKYFRHIWEVDSFSQLATCLDDAGQLVALFQNMPMKLGHIEPFLRRVQWCREDKNTYEALKFTERVAKANAQEVDPLLRVSLALQQQLEDLYRHLGCMTKAYQCSLETVKRLEQLGDLTSFQELLDAKVRLAAAMFDCHDFPSAIELLAPLIDEVEACPRMVKAESQIMLYNTYARAMMIGDTESDWNHWFEKTLKLQAVVDPDNCARTISYIVHGLLRANKLDEAQMQLQNARSMKPDLYTSTFLNFYQADYARRQGEVWEDMEFEKPENHVGGYAYGFYLQATARQNGRPIEERRSRFKRAREEFEEESKDSHKSNVLKLFAGLMRLAESMGNKEESKADFEGVKSYLTSVSTPRIKAHYIDLLPTSATSVDDLEALFTAVPYF